MSLQLAPYRVRCPDLDANNAWHTVTASSVEDAAICFVMQREWNRCEFPIAGGRAEVTVWVLPPGESLSPPRPYTVRGRAQTLREAYEAFPRPTPVKPPDGG